MKDYPWKNGWQNNRIKQIFDDVRWIRIKYEGDYFSIVAAEEQKINE
jgi:hypothetical protein